MRLTKREVQAFGVYASSIKNTEPTSRGFDFYTYANADPYVEPGNEPDADKFNARAYRSMEALMKRAKRLEKLVRDQLVCASCAVDLQHGAGPKFSPRVHGQRIREQQLQ